MTSWSRPASKSPPKALLGTIFMDFRCSWAPFWLIWDWASVFNVFRNMFAIRFAECNHFSIYFGHIAQWIFNTSSRLFPRLARLIAKLAKNAKKPKHAIL